MSTMRIMTPEGKIKEIDRVVPVIEKRLTFNGEKRRLVEVTKNASILPNGLAIKYAISGCGIVREQELFIGNLRPAVAAQIKHDLLKNGYYDFTGMDYQDVDVIDKTVFDNGESKPYTSDITCGMFSSFTDDIGCAAPYTMGNGLFDHSSCSTTELETLCDYSDEGGDEAVSKDDDEDDEEYDDGEEF